MTTGRTRHARFSGDPFQILGIARGADIREVRAAYRRLAKQYHPDVNASPDAAEQMARINWAYQVALEHARHEGPRTYRGGTHAQAPRAGKTRWYVRQRPPPAGGKLVALTRHVHLRGMRGENTNVEALVVVENRGTGPLEGEVKAVPAWVIVSPKQFTLEPNNSQMFRVSAPNRYCGEATSEATLVFESNGGDERVKIEVPCADDVLLSLEPMHIDLGEVEAGAVREVRLRLTFRGKGVPRMQVQPDRPWLEVGSAGLPRRTQYFRLTVRVPDVPGEHTGSLSAAAGAARARSTVRVTAVAPAG